MPEHIRHTVAGKIRMRRRVIRKIDAKHGVGRGNEMPERRIRQCESAEGLTDRRVRIEAQRRTVLLECEMSKIAIGDDDPVTTGYVCDRVQCKLRRGSSEC